MQVFASKFVLDLDLGDSALSAPPEVVKLSREMELPPPHVLLKLDAIIVAQRESDGARVVATASAAATPPRPVSRWHGEVKAARTLACLQENPKRDQSKCWVRYEAYKSATTVAEFLAKGGTPADLAHDVEKGYVWYLDAKDSQEDEPTPAMTEQSRRVVDGEVMPAKRARGPPKARQSVAEPVAQKKSFGGVPKPVEMRRIGDAEWRWFGSHKWSSQIFPGHEFDNLDEFRAAKKQRAEQRIAYSDQNIGHRGSSSSEKWSSLRHML